MDFMEGIWELSTRNGNIKMVVYYNELLKNYNFISLPPFQGALSGELSSTIKILKFIESDKTLLIIFIILSASLYVGTITRALNILFFTKIQI